jgi:hypothetical protein
MLTDVTLRRMMEQRQQKTGGERMTKQDAKHST